MKNIDVINAFVKNEAPCKTKNLSWDGERLVNYYTVLAERDSINQRIFINMTKYSSSTSTIQNAMRRELMEYIAGLDITVSEFTNVDIGTRSLKDLF